jgi:prohibitin 1
MINKLLNSMIYLGGSMFFLGVGALKFSFVVDGGQKALMFDAITGRGVRDKVYGEGIHFRIPFLYEPIIFSVRLNPTIIETKTPARDLQLIDITVRILEKPDEENLKKLYIDQRQNYAQKVLPNITHETIKAVVARYNPDELITQRENVSMEIRQGLVNKAKEFNIIINDVAIVHIEFSKEYRQAIENKQVSQQMAERAKFIVMKSEQEKRVTVIRAEAESESAKLFNLAIAEYGNAFLELKKLETALSIVENVSKSDNISFLPSGQNSNFLYKI